MKEATGELSTTVIAIVAIAAIIAIFTAFLLPTLRAQIALTQACNNGPGYRAKSGDGSVCCSKTDNNGTYTCSYYESDIAIGNILGSNIFNMLLIIGVSALIKPIVYNMSYNIDMIFVVVATTVLALFPLIPPKNKMSRGNGLVYVILYAIYLGMLLLK